MVCLLDYKPEINLICTNFPFQQNKNLDSKQENAQSNLTLM